MQSSSRIVTIKPSPNVLQARCPSCRPTNSVKALNGKVSHSVDLLSPAHLGVFDVEIWALENFLVEWSTNLVKLFAVFSANTWNFSVKCCHPVYTSSCLNPF